MTILSGLVLALVAVLLVLEPLLRAASGRVVTLPEPIFSDSDDEDDPRLARRDRALAALKEIDFDRATGKLSDEDYERLKSRFTAEALEALRAADAASIVNVGSVPGPPSSAPANDAVEQLIAAARSNGGAHRKFCIACGAGLHGRGRFCVECGTPVHAG